MPGTEEFAFCTVQRLYYAATRVGVLIKPGREEFAFHMAQRLYYATLRVGVLYLFILEYNSPYPSLVTIVHIPPYNRVLHVP